MPGWLFSFWSWFSSLAEVQVSISISDSSHARQLKIFLTVWRKWTSIQWNPWSRAAISQHWTMQISAMPHTRISSQKSTKRWPIRSPETDSTSRMVQLLSQHISLTLTEPIFIKRLSLNFSVRSFPTLMPETSLQKKRHRQNLLPFWMNRQKKWKKMYSPKQISPIRWSKQIPDGKLFLWMMRQ